MDIYADVVYSRIGYDVNSYFRSEVITEKLTKVPPTTASGQISRAQFKRGYFAALSGSISLTNTLDMAQLAASSRLQNANCSLILHKSAQNGPSC